MVRIKRQWRLRPFLFSILVLFNASFLILITVSIYVSVSYYFTKQISETRMEMLLNRHQQLQEKIAQIEETALSISTDRNLREALNSTHLNVIDSIMVRRQLNMWLDNFIYIKPYINSIQLYTDRFVDDIAVGGNRRILPLSAIPWTEELDRFNEVDAIWIPANLDTHSEYGETPVLTYVLKISDRGRNTSAYVAVNLAERALAQFLLKESDDHGEPDTYRRVVVLSPDGRVMTDVSSGKTDTTMSGVSAAALQQHISQLGDEAGFQKITVHDADFFMIYTGQSRGGWRLVEWVASEEVYRDINTIRNMMIAIGVVVLILTFPIASYLSNRIIQPIPSLLRGFQKIESGNFATRLEGHTIVELNRLAKSFNHMAEQLQSLLRQLEEEHRLKRDLEVKVLQSQINPHFLYNTLDMINWMAAIKGNLEVSQMAARLARLFRISISKGSTFIPLREELEHARAYAQIQQTRFEDRFEYIERVDARYLPCYVPKIIIQPFIENAIVHGFDPEMKTRARVMVASEAVTESVFRLIIEDNGKGINDAGNRVEEKKNALYVSGTGGYGIRNVDERIRAYLGEPYCVQLQKSEQGGVKVVITLPVIDTKEALKALESPKMGPK